MRRARPGSEEVDGRRQGYVMSENSTTWLSAPNSAAFWREHVRLNHGGLEFRFDRAAQLDETRPHRTQEFLIVGRHCCRLVETAARWRRATRRRQCPIPDRPSERTG